MPHFYCRCCRQRDCASAEHYLPSLLAMYGLDNEVSWHRG